MNEQGPFADILAEMRNGRRDADVWSVFDRTVLRWADRLEMAIIDIRHNYETAVLVVTDDNDILSRENDRLRSLVKRLADMVDSHEVWRPTGRELLLLAEAREATGEARR